MQIKFKNIDLTSFVIREGDFCDTKSYLIFPQHIGCKFTQANKQFRSSVWSDDGELVSAGLPKFKNMGEDPDNFPAPTSLKNVNIITKMDGSLAIVDYYNNKFNVRSRGTLNASILDNGDEWLTVFDKYPKVKDYLKSNPNHTVLFEITTPTNRIVIDYGAEVEFTLISIINKDDYSLLTQKMLDTVSVEHDFKRPKYYSFNSLDEIAEFCNNNKDIEGFCLYSKKDQHIVKCKTDHYKALHRMKSELGSYERVVDFFFVADMPSYQDFYKAVSDTLDFEVAERIVPEMSKICDGYKEVLKIVEFMKEYVETHRHLSRKEFALDTIQKWGKTNRQAMIFSILDKSELSKDLLKKLVYQTTKGISKL
jgi:hypothetical protein